MKEVDYLIVGCGLAGVSFSEVLRAHDRSFVVFDDGSQQSSAVAAGLYNPVVLKRFTKVWKAKEQLGMAKSCYGRLENLTGIKLDYPLPIYRRFASAEEQNDWSVAADQPALHDFLSPKIYKNTNPAIVAPFGFGVVQHAGRIDTTSLLRHYTLYLKTVNSYVNDRFDYTKIQLLPDGEVRYKNLIARYLVFAEGFGVVKNPYFQKLPLKVAKGEILTINAPDLKMPGILKSSIFIVPEGEDSYSVGSTYNWNDQTNAPTQAAREELVEKLKALIQCSFEVIDHVAGVRPTVIDRRPLVGVHPQHNQMAVLNGLGTRGVMIGPYVARQLFDHLEQGTPLDAEIDIQRFKR